MRSIDSKFYKSALWESVRKNYIDSVNGLCENCLAKGIYTPAVHVHHIIHLNEQNVSDPLIAYGFDNLKALCHQCHNEEHFKKQKQNNYVFDNFGNIVRR